jgi:spore coat protein U-like protein
LLCALVVRPGMAQQINFGAYTTSQGISLLASGNLDFNAKQPVIASGSGSTVTIALTDNETQYIQIIGDATRDITVTVSAPQYLTIGGGGPGNQIPFTCQFAYSNLGSSDVASAKAVAIQVPTGFTAITFPMLRRLAGTPAPPPTPAHGGYTAPSATAYLFLYGSLGPVGNVTPGSYSGTINVTVQYQ